MTKTTQTQFGQGIDDKQILVIFGASGDLTMRKLMPALFDLYCQELLPKNFAILGTGRSQLSEHDFRQKMADAIEQHSNRKDFCPKKRDHFLCFLHFFSMHPDVQSDYAGLKDRLTELYIATGSKGNVIYYLATPPQLYAVIAENLESEGLSRQESPENGWKRLIIEKPFGYSHASAKDLNASLLKGFSEGQLYRIDHYLGKETVQNLLVTRFANGIYEPLWNRNFIQHVEITSAEHLGIGTRGGYYEHSGALRDMIQNHLMQILGLVAMEPPARFDSQEIRNETLKVFESLRPLTMAELKHDVIRGQYTASMIGAKHVKGYRQESNVDPLSKTETYVALKCYIDNWRWGGVPFYIRTGKSLPTKVTEVVIYFRPTPVRLFADRGFSDSCNQLIIRIQPDEGLLLRVGAKVPGAGFNVQNIGLDFHFSQLEETYLPSAYERLLLDCMGGDATLYARGDAVDACWRFVDPILRYWEEHPDAPLYGYPAGSWGPEEANELFDECDTLWRSPCKNLAIEGDFCRL